MQTIPTIGVLVISDDKVLLVKHKPKASHLTGAYGLPAGRLEENEKTIDGAVRELREETGLEVSRNNLLHLPHVFYADIPRKGGEIAHMKWDVFVAKEFLGELKESEETSPEWIPLKDVHTLSNLLPNTENAIREGLQLLSK